MTENEKVKAITDLFVSILGEIEEDRREGWTNYMLEKVEEQFGMPMLENIAANIADRQQWGGW